MWDKIKKVLNGIHPQKFEANHAIKILVVDDNEVDRKLIAGILMQHGYNVESAVDGKQGLELTASFQPDLILLDYHMPNIDGFTMCNQVRDQHKNVPVIFISSTVSTKDILNCFEADAENCLSKPIKPKVLISQVQTVLKDYQEKQKDSTATTERPADV